MCLFFVGCGDGGPDDDLEDEFYSSSLEGVKVLSRPANYNFGDAVGEYSEYYYNLFSANILKELHDTYTNQSVQGAYWDTDILKNIDTSNGQTFSSFENESNKYYLYDSIRYKITEVTTNHDENDNIIGQQLVLDLNSGWNWNIKYNANDNDDTKLEKIIFLNLSESYGIGNLTPNANDKINIDFTTAFENVLNNDWR